MVTVEAVVCNLFFSKSIPYKEVRAIIGRDCDVIPAFLDLSPTECIPGMAIVSIDPRKIDDVINTLEMKYHDTTVMEDGYPIVLGDVARPSVETMAVVIIVEADRTPQTIKL